MHLGFGVDATLDRAFLQSAEEIKETYEVEVDPDGVVPHGIPIELWADTFRRNLHDSRARWIADRTEPTDAAGTPWLDGA
jgi:hypothetical protein